MNAPTASSLALSTIKGQQAAREAIAFIQHGVADPGRLFADLERLAPDSTAQRAYLLTVEKFIQE